MKIKLFLDGANLEEILSFKNASHISGFTTNPSLMKKAGVSDYMQFAETLSFLRDNNPDLPFKLSIIFCKRGIGNSTKHYVLHVMELKNKLLFGSINFSTYILFRNPSYS